MPILPIDSSRYGSEEMKRVFDEESRLRKMLDVEAALAEANADVGNIPRSAARKIARMASTRYVKLDRVRALEGRVRHETEAVVEALAERVGDDAANVHVGATSSDILDSATALQMGEGLNILGGRLKQLLLEVRRLSSKHMDTVMAGRTHGQVTHPITLGLKFAVWLRELARHLQRLSECKQRLLVGKMSGAVGTMAGFGEKGLRVQRIAMRRLGLGEPEVTTQIIQRDRYAELICVLANLASSIDKFATEIRNLQRTEIAELAEPFDFRRQIGSSTMPHKINPVVSENISSLARIVRSLVPAALENVVIPHERDLTHSAAERFLIPEAFILVDQMLLSMTGLLRGLRVDRERMKRNLKAAGPVIMSEAVMLALIKKWMPRRAAHRLIRELALRAITRNRDFRELLRASGAVRRLLSGREIDRALDPFGYLGKSRELVRQAIAVTDRELRSYAR